MTDTPAPPGWPHPQSPFHPGEQALQSRYGYREQVEAVGRRALRDHLTEQHREFYAALPLIFAAACSADGQPHAGLICAAPGFISSPDEHHLHLAARPAPDDPLHALLQPGTACGLLGLIPAARRRNRANGRLQASAHGLLLHVEQSFGNCPKYIVPRQPLRPHGQTPHALPASTALSAADQALIAAADTCFIASADPDYGCDISHRGGPPGFIRSPDPHTLLLPDYAGNRYFNTFGNLHHNPRAGLLFIDFNNGDLLYLTATTTLRDAPPPLPPTPGDEPAPLRLLELHLTSVRRVAHGSPWVWQSLAAS